MTDPDADPFPLTEEIIPVADYARLDPTWFTAQLSELMAKNTKLDTELTQHDVQAETEMAGLLTELFDVADALERLAARTARSSALDEGATGTHKAAVTAGKLLRRALAARGAERLQLVGQQADPLLADIEYSVPEPTLPDETVVQELRAAYTLHGAVLRRGVVVVSEREPSIPGNPG